MCGLCNVWLCLCVGFVKYIYIYIYVCVCVCVCVCGWVLQCVDVSVICVLVFTVFLYCFVYANLFFVCFCLIL